MEYSIGNDGYRYGYDAGNYANSQNMNARLLSSQDASNSTSSNSIYDDFNKWQEDSYTALELGETNKVDGFDFVDSDISYKDSDFIEPYKKGLNELADANLSASDSDNSGGISYNEYVKQEIGGYNNLFEDEAIEFDEETGAIGGEYGDFLNEYMQNSFGIIDANTSGEIESGEIASFFAAYDSLDSKDATVDGKIQYESVSNIDITSDDFKNRYENALKLFNTAE